MSALVFDTHSFVKKLIAAGMPERQAEVLAEEQATLIDTKLATKDDLRLLEQSLTIRTGAMIIALGGFLAAIKFFA